MPKGLLATDTVAGIAVDIRSGIGGRRRTVEHEGLADAMETIRDVAPAASSGTLAGVVGYGWRVGRAVARGVVGAAGGWVAWAGRAVGMRCSSASPLHEKMCSGELWAGARATFVQG